MSTSKAEAARIQAMLVELQTALRESNGYVRDFLTSAEVFEQGARTGDVTNAQFVINPDARPSDEHARKYDPPLGRRRAFQEVSVLIARDRSQIEASCSTRETLRIAPSTSSTKRAAPSTRSTSCYFSRAATTGGASTCREPRQRLRRPTLTARPRTKR